MVVSSLLDGCTRPMSTYYRRTGDCNQCGNCCENSPWPTNWPDAIRNRKPEHVLKMWPQAKHFPLPVHGGRSEGVVTVEGEKFPFKWVPGASLCKSDDLHECPFLTGVKGDEQRPCGIYGTNSHYMWEDWCRQFPDETFESKERVDEWFRNNPDCSYTFEEVDAPSN